jgi:hypothetical protein
MDQIYITGIPDYFPEHMKDGNGLVALDLPEGFSFEFTEQMEELTDANKIKGAGMIDFEVNLSLKNWLILSPYISVLNEGNQYNPIRVTAITGTGETLPQELLEVLNYTDDSATLRLIDADIFWGKLASEKALNTIDLGIAIYSANNLINSWPYHEYIDQPYYFGPAHYGAFQEDIYDHIGGWIVEDFRPFLSPIALLKKGFREIGWTLESPLFDNSFFRRMWAYLLNTEFTHDGNGASYQAVMEYPNGHTQGFQQSGTATVEGRFNPEVYLPVDTSGNFPTDLKDQLAEIDFPNFGVNLPDQKISTFTNLTNGSCTFKVRIQFDFTNTSEVYALSSDLIVAVLGEVGEPIQSFPNLSFPADQTTNFDLEFEANLGPYQSFQFWFGPLRGFPTTTAPSAFFAQKISNLRIEITPNDPTRLFRDEELPLGEMIHPDYKLLDLFKGFLHLCSGKVLTDYNTRTLTIYPNEKSTFDGEDIEGFFLDNSEMLDLTNKILPGSRQVDFSGKGERYYVLGFKEARDAYITSEELETREDPLYGRKLDLGANYPERTKSLRNPFFEPTAQGSDRGVALPYLWDNEDGKISREIGPRIVLAGGLAEVAGQIGISPTNGIPGLGWIFEGELRAEFPLFGQKLDYTLRTGATTFEPLDDGIVFTDTAYSLFQAFWRYEVGLRVFTPLESFELLSDHETYRKMNFRRKVLIHYLDQTFIGVLKRKEGYKTGYEAPYRIEVKPEPQLIDL